MIGFLRRGSHGRFGVLSRAAARRRTAVAVGAATLLVSGPAWALPRPVPQAAAAAAAPSHSDLAVIRTDPDDAPPGGTTSLHGFVANSGSETTSSPMDITPTLPRGTSPQKPYVVETAPDH
ncbi:hypothetical protein [Streptomyces sp. NPDC101206]|uniref:hypothetical protein n=1 Tax=Streptomyces sp. NPDC101206 TaxID=3366128 RepID=UPI0037FD68F6